MKKILYLQTDYWSCYVDGQFGEDGIGCAGYGIINIDGITTGNLGLKEEEGDSYAVGGVWEPMDRMVVTVDAFHINLRYRFYEITLTNGS